MVFCNNGVNTVIKKNVNSHNPYFNRWFSAMWNSFNTAGMSDNVTILILIDGFLQFNKSDIYNYIHDKSQSLF